MHSLPLMEVSGIVKQFPGVKALKGVAIQLHPGEVVAVLGENGAGKSTLMKILAGVQMPDSGEIRVDGKAVTIDSVRTAAALGIALIHQELNLADNLDVGANLFLGREPQRFGWIDRRAINRDSQVALARVGLKVSPRLLLRKLPIGQQQMVEIAKALIANARVLIMDEPTSSLSQRESERLFEVIHELRGRGVCIVYISHRLGEVKRLADRVVVLRDGENAGELAREQIDHEAMVRLMVGRNLSQFYARKETVPGEVLLEVENLRTVAHPQHAVSFRVRAGEIVGVAGLVGAGRTEMLQALFGVARPLEGTVRVAGRAYRMTHSARAIRAGVSLVPEDRKQQGLILGMNVGENTTLATLSRLSAGGIFPFPNEERRAILGAIEKLRIKTPSARQQVKFLSGGNQQKVVIAKWLAMQPKVLLLDEPTRGIDVGAKQEIYKLMEELAEQGMAVLFVSSEMEEILGMSDRTLVMHEGRMTGELARSELSEEAVMRLATGGDGNDNLKIENDK